MTSPSVPKALPYRPRLADHAMLRRHIVDGKPHILVHDSRREEALEIESERQLRILRCLDGTRDENGIVLAAVARGIYRRASEIRQLLSDLQERGLLADGIEVRDPPAPREPAKPLEPLFGFRLSCDANGTCCSTYSSVPFTHAEAQRALDLVPDAVPPLAEDDPAGRGADLDIERSRLFLPVQGSVDSHYAGVAMVDGHCPFLDPSGRCRIHSLGGAEAKPRGCRIFPATFFDDGEAVRVSVSVECPCVLQSLANVGEGSTLEPPGAKTEGDLLPGTRIVRIPAQIPLTPDKTASPSELRAWSQAVLALADELTDPLAVFWSLGGAVRQDGLSTAAAAAACRQAQPPTTASLGFRLMALARRCADKQESVEGWRSTKDRCRHLSVWLARGADSLLDPTRLGAVLAAGPVSLEHERFYLRATIFGHHLAGSDTLTLEQALRDRAVRLLLARQLPRDVVAEVADHPTLPYPIVAVELMMRGQGLESYADGIP